MALFNRIKTVVTKKEAKYAFIDLACLLLFADNKSALSEQDFLANLISLQVDSSEMLEERYQATMATVKKSGFNSDAMIADISKNLASSELRILAMEFVDEFIDADGKSTPQELILVKKIKAQLSA